jgi:excisionase family DNA binding protein
MADSEEWLTVTDVAQILNIGMPQTYSLLRDGEIVGIQIGGRKIWRVQRKEVDAYIARELAKARERAGRRSGEAATHEGASAQD